MFEEIIAASEYINNDVERIQVEYIAKIRNCLGLFTEFGLYVKNNRMIKSKGHIILEHGKVVVFEFEKYGYITNEKKDFKKHMKIVHRK